MPLYASDITFVWYLASNQIADIGWNKYTFTLNLQMFAIRISYGIEPGSDSTREAEILGFNILMYILGWALVRYNVSVW